MARYLPNNADTLNPLRFRLAFVARPGRLRVAAHNLGEPMAVRPRVWCFRILQKTSKSRSARSARPTCERSSPMSLPSLRPSLEHHIPVGGAVRLASWLLVD